jgi:integrase
MFSLSAIANRAVEKNFLLKNPVVGYKIKPGKESKHVRPLSEKSLRELESEKFDNPSLQFAADMFVFCCHTGLSYTDLVTSVYKEIETDDDGTLWLSSKRNKNQNKYIIPLDAIAMRMIEKYKNSPAELHFKKLLPEYLFPFIRRETYYQLLQKVAKMKSLPEHISPHVARHTFATIMLAKGVSIESIKKMLGHSPSSSATWLYAEVNKSKIKKEVRKTI